MPMISILPSDIHHHKNWYFFNFVLPYFSDGLVVSHLPFGPTAYFTLSNTVMRHDIPKIGTMSEAYPHLIFHNFNSKLGERVSCGHLISGILPKKCQPTVYML